LIDVRLELSHRALQTHAALREAGSATEAVIQTKTIARIGVMLLVGLLTIPRPAEAAELKPEAALGFDRYVHLAEQRMQTELQPGGVFLYVDGLPEARRREAQAELLRGEIVTARVDMRDAYSSLRTPGAMIHHWVGIVFIPGASLEQVLTLLHDYDHHSVYYSPDVTRSKTLDHSGNDFKVYFRLTRKKIVTVVLDTTYDVHYEPIDATHAHSRSYSTRIAEVEHPGEAREVQMTPGEDHGFLWRLNSYWRYRETSEGVYVQCEAISLSRDIPTGLNWLIAPFIESVPKESLEFTLRSTRVAVLGGGLHASK
jgi:hypothetical protein